MAGLYDFMTRLWRDQTGATAIEYALVAGLIGLAIITTATALGTGVSNMWDSVSTQVTNASGR